MGFHSARYGVVGYDVEAERVISLLHFIYMLLQFSKLSNIEHLAETSAVRRFPANACAAIVRARQEPISFSLEDRQTRSVWKTRTAAFIDPPFVICGDRPGSQPRKPSGLRLS